MYLLDSNILIDISRRKLRYAYDTLMLSDASLFKVPAVVKAELLLGAEKSSRPEEERLRVESLLLPFDIVPFDEACAVQYARIRAHLERKGKTNRQQRLPDCSDGIGPQRGPRDQQCQRVQAHPGAFLGILGRNRLSVKPARLLRHGRAQMNSAPTST